MGKKELIKTKLKEVGVVLSSHFTPTPKTSTPSAPLISVAHAEPRNPKTLSPAGAVSKREGNCQLRQVDCASKH